MFFYFNDSLITYECVCCQWYKKFVEMPSFLQLPDFSQYITALSWGNCGFVTSERPSSPCYDDVAWLKRSANCWSLNVYHFRAAEVSFVFIGLKIPNDFYCSQMF